MEWCSRVAFGAFLMLLATGARADILFDASDGVQPDAPQWDWVYLENGSTVTRSIVGGVSTLDTSTTLGDQAGYFSSVPFIGSNANMPTLDLAVSPWVISVGMQIVTGSQLPDTDPLASGEFNRGPFSLIVISDNGSGIELQFRTDGIVALDNANTAFPIGEFAAFDTTDAPHDYQLQLGLAGYELFVDGLATLSGSLRNYSGVAPAFPLNFPYTTPNFIFFGDDTGRAGGEVDITYLNADAGTVPEPATGILLLAGGMILLRRTSSASRSKRIS